MHDPRSRSLPVPLALGAALLAAPALAQTVRQARLPDAYPDGLRGEEAVRALGADLARVARQNGLEADELTALLRRDASAWVANGRVLYVDTAVAPAADLGEPEPRYLAAGSGDDEFHLHSLPGAPRVVYLDFDGHHSVGNSWNHNIMFPAFDTDGDPGTFSAGELNSIVGHFNRVAEDFAPFEVDVTTEEPPAGGLAKNGGGDTTWGIRVVMTQATSGFGNGIGGVAFLNSFDDSIDNPCFAFNKGTNNGAMTASHEAGHTFGLSHDGLNGQEYHPGSGGSGTTSWGPIMGAPFGKNVVHWSDGSYTGASNTQNDYNVITKVANGTPFKADDFGASVPSTNDALQFACPDPSTAVLRGLIERRDDQDAFRFHTRGGLVTIDANTVPGPNIDMLLELYDDTGTLVASDDELNEVKATIAMELSAGSYTVLVDGVGRDGRYTDYGSVGTYQITVTKPVWGDVTPVAGVGPVLVGQGTACDLAPVELAVSGAPAGSQALLFFGLDELPQPLASGALLFDLRRAGVLALPVDGAGHASVTRLWPAGIPSGTEVVFQAWTLDRESRTLATTNAIAVLVP